MTMDSMYRWTSADPTCAHEYNLPMLTKLIKEISLEIGKSIKILDIGCGNGAMTSKLAQQGYSIVGIDASREGIDKASSTYPNVQFKVCSIYDENIREIAGGEVDCVISMEVIEHLFCPKKFFEQNARLIRPQGYRIVSTPYHGYFKNLMLSLINGWDRHFSVHRDGGHIKFFSKKTLFQMASDAGFKNPRFIGVGRCLGLWKSIIMVVKNDS